MLVYQRIVSVIDSVMCFFQTQEELIPIPPKIKLSSTTESTCVDEDPQKESNTYSLRVEFQF